MKRRPGRLRAPELGHVNVTPLIDVVMCMIVFYLIVGKLAADQRSNVRLPVSRTGQLERGSDHLVINVVPGRAAGAGPAPTRVVIDRRDVDPAELRATIASRLADRPGVVVEIRASRDLAYGDVASVVRACKDAGVESVRLATERPG